MNHNDTLNKANKCCKRYYGYKLHKEMHTHYKDLFETAVKELRATNMYIEHLYSALDEIDEISDDTLVKSLCKHHKERHQLDKMCHTRNLFTKPNGFNE